MTRALPVPIAPGLQIDRLLTTKSPGVTLTIHVRPGRRVGARTMKAIVRAAETILEQLRREEAEECAPAASSVRPGRARCAGHEDSVR